MKPALALCSTALLLLSACSGGTALSSAVPASSAPSPAEVPSLSIPLMSRITEPAPCAEALSELPFQLTTSPAELWGDQPILLLAQLPEEDISLYGLPGGDNDSQLLLRKEDSLTLYDLPWLTPRSVFPQLCQGDYDGDGDTELLLLTYTGSGTGVSSWTLTVLENTTDGWVALTLPDLSYDNDLSPLLSCQHQGDRQASAAIGQLQVSFPLPDSADDEVPLEAYTGTIVEYMVSGNTISVKLAVGIHQEGFISYTCEYPLQLEGQILYEETGFSLGSLTLTEYSD